MWGKVKDERWKFDESNIFKRSTCILNKQRPGGSSFIKFLWSRKGLDILFNSCTTPRRGSNIHFHRLVVLFYVQKQKKCYWKMFDLFNPFVHYK
jgi:hypothetical protein